MILKEEQDFGDMPEEELIKLIDKIAEDVVNRVIEFAQESEECSICLDVVTNGRIIPNCGHVFCWECLGSHMVTQGQASTCPGCRGSIDATTLIPLEAFKEVHGLIAKVEEEVPTFAEQIREIKEEYDWINYLSPSHIKRLRAKAKAEEQQVDYNVERAKFVPSSKILRCMEILDEITETGPSEKIISMSY